MFTINVENVPCGGYGVTCTKSVTIFYNNRKIQLIDGNTLYVDDAPQNAYSDHVIPGVVYKQMQMTNVLIFVDLEIAVESDGG